MSLVVLGIAGVGLTRGRIGQTARVVGTVGALALVVAGWQVGHSGGSLVYQHGAASAYTKGDVPTVGAASASSQGHAVDP